MWVLMGRARRLYEASDVSRGAQLCARKVAQRLRRTETAGAPRITLVIVLGCLGMQACGAGGPVTPGMDAGDGQAPDQGNTDAGREVSISPPSCMSVRTVCDEASVRACVGGQPGDELELCPEACSLGRCTTLACKLGEMSGGGQGCRFYGVQPDNVDSDDDRTLMVILSNASLTPAAARVEVREPGGPWSPLASEVIPAGGGVRIQVKRPVTQPGVTPGGAYRIETDRPVLAVQVVSDDSNHAARSSGGTVLLPLQGLAGDYLAVAFPARASPDVLRTPGSRGGAGAITVVGTAADTHVSVGLTTVATLYAAGAQPEAMAGPVEVLLGDGDVLQIFSDDPDGDLTGTSIDADAPVAVFSGNIYTTYGYPITGSHGGDLAHEQLPPTLSWNDDYIGARLSPQVGCDPFFGDGIGHWRVVAASGGATVTVLPAPGTSIEGANLSPDLTFQLGRGGFQSFSARGSRNPSPGTSGDFLVHADNPILLVQWLDCEPGLSLGIDGRLSAGPIAFTLPPGFDHELVLVRKGESVVMFDGHPVPDDRWRSGSHVGEYGVVRLGATELGPCADLFDPCEHYVSGTAFGLGWRGMDVVCGYALTVPPGNECALPNVTCID